MIEAQKRKEELEIQRKERRKRNRDQEIPENQLCVVCRSNPREVAEKLKKSNWFLFLYIFFLVDDFASLWPCLFM